MSNFQTAANEFLESIDLSPMLEDDLDGELVLEINQNFSLVFGFDQTTETCVLRILFNDLPTDTRVLTELLQNSNTLDVAGYNLTFGLEVAIPQPMAKSAFQTATLTLRICGRFSRSSFRFLSGTQKLKSVRP